MGGSKSLWEGLLLTFFGIATLALAVSYGEEPAVLVDSVFLEGRSVDVGLSGPTEQLAGVAIYAGLTSGVDWDAKKSDAVHSILRRPGVELMAQSSEIRSGYVKLELPKQIPDKPLRVVLRFRDGTERVGPDVDSQHYVRQRAIRLGRNLYLLAIVAILGGLVTMTGVLRPRGASTA